MFEFASFALEDVANIVSELAWRIKKNKVLTCFLADNDRSEPVTIL